MKAYGNAADPIVAEWIGRRILEASSSTQRVTRPGGGIGLDLSRPYLEMAQRRIDRPHAPITTPGREEFHPLFPEAD